MADLCPPQPVPFCRTPYLSRWLRAGCSGLPASAWRAGWCPDLYDRPERVRCGGCRG